MNVVIADDHPIFLGGLRELIDSQPDLTVVAAVDSGEEAVAAVKDKKPEMLISDISMSGINGIEAARQARSACPSIKILMLSMHSERRHVLAALDAGANGYLLKESAREELVSAVRTLASNEAYLSPAIAYHIVDAIKGNSPEDVGLERLTVREREVLRMISNGMSTKQIASELGVSPKTVSTHREHMMNKLDIHSVAELTRFALREGLVSDN
ncbi:MAG: response regulator transcription factor [Gammaproteobacteria bacterium]|nr:response regulator transcription factor [Gammaproteobacteria bacterium]NNF67189.1 response regulator transcription factor [Gammaproteobacteria bacterium]